MIKQVLKNGLTVYVLPSQAAPVVAVQAWVRVGSAQESADQAGLSHLMEHMLFKGTKRRAVGELAREIEAGGGEINAWTDFNNTVFHVVLASRFFSTGLDVIADMVQHPSLDATELASERQVVLEELGQGEDSPHRKNAHQLFGLAFRKHPYRLPVIGRRETVSAATRSQLLAFHRQWYRPSNMTLVVAGAVDPERAMTEIKAAFRGRFRPPPPVAQFTEGPQRAPRLAVSTADVREAYLLAGFPIGGLTHEDTPALDLAATLLGHGDSSRLHRRLVRELQVVSDSYAYAYTPHDQGLFTVGASVPMAQLEAAVPELLGELHRLGFERPSEAELSKGVQMLEASAIHQQETVQGLARRVGYYDYTTGDPDYEDDFLRRVAECSPSDVRRAVDRWLHPRHLSLSLVIPEGQNPAASRREVERLLKPQLSAPYEAQKAARPARSLRPGRQGVARLELEAGPRLLIKRDETVPLVAARAVWPGGLRTETPRNNGIHNLWSSLLTRGTRQRSADDIISAIEGKAGSIGGFTGRNSLGLRLEAVARHWPEGLAIMLDSALHPSFPAAEFAREQQLALQEIDVRDDNPTGVAFRLFQQTLFTRHPYRLSLLGERDVVERFTAERLARAFKRSYRPEDLVLSVVGDVDPSEVADEVAAAFEGLRPRKALSRRIVSEPPLRAPRSVVRHLPREQAHVLLGYPGLTVSHADRHTLEVLIAVLSGQGGRLFLNIRDRLGLVYRISALSLEGVDPGYVAVYGATSPDQVDVLVREIRGELKRLRRDGITAKELSRAKRYLVGLHDISLQQRATVASNLAFSELYGLGYESYFQTPQAIGRIDRGGVLRLARRLLKPSRECLAIVTPEPADETV